MSPTATFWWQLLGRLALEAGGLVSLTAIVAWRVKSVAWQQTAWQTCLLGLLALFVCELTGVGKGLRSGTSGEIAPLPNPPVVVETVSPAFQPAPPQVHTSELGAENFNAAPAEHTNSGWWPGLVWLTGTCLLLARQGLARTLFLARRIRPRPIRDAALLARVQTLARRLGLRQPIRATQAIGLSGPIVYGAFRPTICLPAGFVDEFTPAQQDAMLAHELAHVVARDPGWYFLADVLAAVWWWHPGVWWVRRRLQAASEQAADEASLIVEGGPGALAECLVALGCRLAETGSSNELGVNGTGFRSGLGQRVTRLLNSGDGPWRSTGHLRTWLARTTGAFAATLALLAAGAWAARDDAGPPLAIRVWQYQTESLTRKANSSPAQTVLLAQTESKPASPTEGLGEERPVDAFPGTDQPAIDERLIKLVSKLERIRFNEVSFDQAPLREVGQKLAEMIKLRDPEKQGINVLVQDNLGGAPITISMRLENVTAREALDAVTKSASAPLDCRIEAYAVVFSVPACDLSKLHTRFFKFDTNVFFCVLWRSSQPMRRTLRPAGFHLQIAIPSS